MSKIIRILNPAAGHGDAALAENISTGNPDVVHKTTAVGDAEVFAAEICREHPDSHFEVFGGDGTVAEVVNGIMSSGAGKTASFSVIPTGSGNDFVRNFKSDKPSSRMIDLIRFNGRYCVNMINIGFDCDVVVKALHYKSKKLVSGSAAYMMGIVNVLFKKLGHPLEAEYTLKDGGVGSQTEEFLLCSIANGSYCGGGIKAAPIASLTDGLLDFFRAKKVTRLKFISLFSDYKKGTYISGDEELADRFKGIMFYDRCLSVRIKSPGMICSDGELVNIEGDLDISVEPKAIRYVY